MYACFALSALLSRSRLGLRVCAASAAKLEARHRYQAPKPGEPIYKGHRSYDLMRALQLGITFSIAQSGLVSGLRRSMPC